MALWNFRKKILLPYAEEAGIDLFQYLSKRGLITTTKECNHNPDYNDTDILINGVAKGLGSSSKKLDTFALLYGCHHIEKVSEFLDYYDKKNKRHKPLEVETVQKYDREAIKYIHETIDRDPDLKSKIILALKEEYEKLCNKECA
ncbi:MAG: hypothetical protein HF978_06400 [Desulfobacteraceae bacterium]|nr:hypothetical protein [Desulfobacteraceae bacterium]MBC2755161.1 hypothetical protein [Desulfobacteraceae bacterium]